LIFGDPTFSLQGSRVAEIPLSGLSISIRRVGYLKKLEEINYDRKEKIYRSKEKKGITS